MITIIGFVLCLGFWLGVFVDYQMNAFEEETSIGIVFAFLFIGISFLVLLRVCFLGLTMAWTAQF